MDFAQMARTARESLARGLNALQSPGVPSELMSAAEPIAEAMSSLHHIEATQGAAVHDSSPTALLAARRALAQLQAQSVAHPAVDQALEAVADSLGVIHELSRVGASRVPAPPTQQSHVVAPAPPSEPTWSSAEPAPHPPHHHAPPWQQQQPPTWEAQPAPQQWQQQVQPAQPPPSSNEGWPSSSEGWPSASAPAQAQWPQASPPGAQSAWPAQAQAQAPGQGAWGNTMPAATEATRVLYYDADLGAHSPTNFYKGLSGNDVIDSGGLFIATYQIPSIGRNVHLKVSLPGGYEFEAAGIVRWTREAPNPAADSPPGFGVQFTHISPEGRQLVYRYVRNREPLFHDDQ